MPVIPALERLRQEDCEFKANLDYIVRPYLNTSLHQKKKKRVSKGLSERK
jgi:hypothetical protein